MTDVADEQEPASNPGALQLRDSAVSQDAPSRTLTGLGPFARKPGTVSYEPPRGSAPLTFDSADLRDDIDDGDEQTLVYMDPLSALIGKDQRSLDNPTSVEPNEHSGARALPSSKPLPTPEEIHDLAHAPTLDSLLEEVVSTRRPRSNPPVSRPPSTPPRPLRPASVAPSAPARSLATQQTSIGSFHEATPPSVIVAPAILEDNVTTDEATARAPEGESSALPATIETPLVAPVVTRPDEATSAQANVGRTWRSEMETPPDLGVAQSSGAPPTSIRSRALANTDAPSVFSAPARVGGFRSKLWTTLLAFGLSLLLTVGALAVLLPRSGALLITAESSSGRALNAAEVWLDGKRVCQAVPCAVDGLQAGNHVIEARANKHLPIGNRQIYVKGGSSTALELTLAEADTAALEVRTSIPALTVELDGQNRGVAPLTIAELPAGTHSVRIAGNPLYVPFERRLTLERDRVTVLEPEIVPAKQRLTLSAGPGAEGALIELSNEEGKERIRKLPVTIEIDPTRHYRLYASHTGYRDLRANLVLNPAKAEQRFLIALRPAGGPAEPPAPADVHLEEEPVPVANTATTISLSSTPAANVLVDGRLLGETPKQVPVTPGSHTVVFIHSSLGRKELNVKVSPGKNAVASVHF